MKFAIMVLSVALLACSTLITSVNAAGLTELKCGHRFFNLVSPSLWTCCGGRLYPKKANFFACCDKRCYNPMSQFCCGSDIYPRLNINSACCNGRAYQRGLHACCDKKVINLKTQDCCREKTYMMKTHLCCDGVVSEKDTAHNRTECCGKSSYDPHKEMCCAEKVVLKTAGIHTKCCAMGVYDSRTESCCMHKVIPRVEGKNECCNGIMIDSKLETCCGGDVKPRIYGRHTGCCRVGGKSMIDLTEDVKENNMDELLGGVHVTYDQSESMCCSGKLSFKKYGSEAACCNQEVYNAKTHLCCLDKVHARIPGLVERCCDGKAFDRSRHICCHGKLHDISKHEMSFQFCCGENVYDRRRAHCDENMTISKFQCEDPIYIYGNRGNKIPMKSL